jgi:hypothetical protein
LAAILSAAQMTKDISSAPATALNSSGFNPIHLEFFYFKPFLQWCPGSFTCPGKTCTSQLGKLPPSRPHPTCL